MTKDEALRLALEALENAREFFISTQELGIRLGVSAKDVRLGERFIADRAITAIKAALEAKDEPWEKFCDSHCVWTDHHPDCKLAKDEPVMCGACNGSGHMVRDPDIGTDQECFVCEGSGVFKDTTPPQQEAKDEPVDFEAIIDDIEAIDCRYRGDPSYDRDAYWMRNEVVATVKRHASFYTNPPHRKPLTDEQIFNVISSTTAGDMPYSYRIARAIEAAHGIKGEA